MSYDTPPPGCAIPSPWRLRLLGALVLSRGDRVLRRFRQQRTGLLLAMLARTPGQALPRDTLVERLWPEVAPEVGRPRLRVLLAELRAVLEEGLPRSSVLEGDHERVSLRPHALRTDLEEMEESLRAARQARDPLARAEALATALRAGGGTFLPGHDDAWTAGQRRVIEEQQAAACHALAVAWEEAGRPLEALETLLVSHPGPDRPAETQGRLMRLFLAAGRPEAGLESFRGWERHLLHSTGRKAPPSLRELAAALEGSLRETAARPGEGGSAEGGPVGLRVWIAAHSEPEDAVAGALLAYGTPALGRTDTVWVPRLEGALALLAQLRRIPGARVAMDIAGDEGGPDRVRRLLRGAPQGAVLVGDALAGLLRQRQPAPLDLRSLGTYDVPGLEPLALWGVVDDAGSVPVPLHARISEARAPAPRALFGRAELLDTLAGLLLPGSLVTLTGMGGIGKTTLATAVAARPGIAAEVVFVDLSTTTDAAQATRAMALALGLESHGGGLRARVAQRLAGAGAALVVLDNAEQIAMPLAALVAELRTAAPRVAWCCTSRLPLGVVGERTVELPGLALPHGALSLEALAQVPSIALFLAKARQVGAFSLSEENARLLRELVVALEGIPLAIELAASRVRGWDLPSLLGRLGARTLDVLAWRGRPGPTRQATLRATLDWSWDLLTPGERATLAQLSVFRGGFCADAVEAVVDLSATPDAPFALDALDALVSHSLVRVLPGEGGPVRYGLFVVVAEYAAEKLLDPSLSQREARLRHARWYARLGTIEALDALEGPDGEAARATVQVEQDNLQAAASFALAEGDPPTAEALARVLLTVIQIWGGLDTFDALLEGILARPDLPALAQRELLLQVALARFRRHSERAVLEAAMVDRAPPPVTAEPSRLLQRVWWREAQVLAYLGLLDEAIATMQASMTAPGHPFDLARAEALIAGALVYRGDHTGALAAWKGVLARAREHGFLNLESFALIVLIGSLEQNNQLPEARALLPATLDLARRVGGTRHEVVALVQGGAVAAGLGEVQEAETLLQSADRLAARAGLYQNQLEAVLARALLDCQRGLWARAVAVAEPLIAELENGGARMLSHATFLPQALARVGRAEDGVALAERWLDRYVGTTFYGATETLVHLGMANWLRGDREAAVSAWERALALGAAPDNRNGGLLARGRLGQLALAQGDWVRADTLLSPLISGIPGELPMFEAGLREGWLGLLAVGRGDRVEGEDRLARIDQVQTRMAAEPGSELGELAGVLREALGPS